MSVILYLILLALSGLVVGALGRLLLPGRDPMSVPQTILIGIAGSAAGLVALALFRSHRGGGLLLSVVFAALFVWLVRRSRERSHDPGAVRPRRWGL